MKRKDWRIKNLKKGTFDKKKKFQLKERFLFLRKLFLRRSKYLIRKNLFFNYFFFKKLLTSYKTKKQLSVFRIFFRTKLPKRSFFPEFSTSKNVFNKRRSFNNLLKKHSLRYTFLKNYYTKNVGLNYYLPDSNSDKLNNLNLTKDLLDDDFLNLIHFKTSFDGENNLEYLLNYHFNYNLHNLCLVEMYKIIIILNLKN